MTSCVSEVVLCWYLLSVLSVTVAGYGCQHNCDCGFDSDGKEKDVTLRYEVMSGLVGAFAPLTLGGLGFLAYKFCMRPTGGVPETKPTRMAPFPSGGNAGHAPMATAHPHDGWGRGGGGGGGAAGYGDFSGGNRNNINPGGGEPLSLYGESDDGIPPGGDSQNQGRPTGRGHRPGTCDSNLKNIHRNIKDDMTNQWLLNVNLRKY